MILSDNAKEYQKHPEGEFVGVCVDIVDLGLEQTAYGMKPKVRIVFETEATVEKEINGQTVLVPATISRKFTASLNEKAPLRAFLEAWRGRKFTAGEAKAFDAEQLLGVPAYLNVNWEWSQDGTKQYDNIMSCMKLPRGLDAIGPSGNYQRVKDRPVQAQPGARPQPSRPQPATPQARRPQPVAAHAQRQAPPAQDYTDLPGALQDDTDDLPF
jgi:hypothetical protein